MLCIILNTLRAVFNKLKFLQSLQFSVLYGYEKMYNLVYCKKTKR